LRRFRLRFLKQRFSGFCVDLSKQKPQTTGIVRSIAPDWLASVNGRGTTDNLRRGANVPELLESIGLLDRLPDLPDCQFRMPDLSVIISADSTRKCNRWVDS
jgi:hypothetical protein